MATHKSWFRLAPALALIFLLSTPAEVESQCAVVSQMTSSAGSFVRITKTLSMAGNCATPASMAFGCGRAPAATMATKLVATALTGMTSTPYCNWVCDCGAGFTSVMIVTDGSDGLPVELMDFAIEG